MSSKATEMDSKAALLEQTHTETAPTELYSIKVENDSQ